MSDDDRDIDIESDVSGPDRNIETTTTCMFVVGMDIRLCMFTLIPAVFLMRW